MIPVVITATIYGQQRKACINEVIAISKQTLSYPQVLLVDHYSNLTPIHKVADNDVSYINLSEWLNQTDQCHQPSIRSTAKKLHSSNIVVLDARNYRASVISSVLNEVSFVWAHLAQWQVAFVLIVDDEESIRFLEELFKTFYVNALSTTKQKINSEVKGMRRRIRNLRWIGIGRFSRLFYQAYFPLQRLTHYLRSWFRPS